MTLNQRKTYLMVTMADFLMSRWHKSIQEFLQLDAQYGILEYLVLCYEPFHLTGEEGIAQEVEQFIREQGGVV